MNQKFESVPLEPDTVILFEKLHTIGGFEVLYQIWQWENYQANCIIFLNEDVDRLEKNEIIEMVKQDVVFKPGPGFSFSRRESGFTFVNFNFQDVEPDFPAAAPIIAELKRTRPE